tara:strand:+ start:410 stop:751 length:342 start_codon:yes stop_codon:yes gene_type:complete
MMTKGETEAMMSDIKRIDKEIKEQEEVVRLAEIEVYHKDNYGRGPWNELSRLETEREIILTGVKWEHHDSGTVLIENKFVYALNSGKWRIKGKQKWYWSKSVEHFIEKYVRRT